MFKKKQPSPPPLPQPSEVPNQYQHSRYSGSSSSNALVSNHPHSHHTHIPMDDLSSSNNNHGSDPEKMVHDPLPPAVDYTGVAPSARYQFRALARRALSYHRRQRMSNLCCLVLWPVILVLLCFVFAMVMEGGRSSGGNWKGKVRFCVNEADVQNGTSFSLGNVDLPEDGSMVVNAGWYPSTFWSDSMVDLPCVRWFGDRGYPAKAPYQNSTAQALAQPDSYYIPPPPDGWFKVPMMTYNNRGRNPQLWSARTVNQTVYFSAANPEVARLLGQPPKLTPSFKSETWPPTNASIIYNATTPANAGSGLLGAIPARFASRLGYEGAIRDKYGYITGGNMNRTMQYSPQQYLPLADVASLEKAVHEMIIRAAEEEDRENYQDMPFGAIYFESLKGVEAASTGPLEVAMTMQIGQVTPPSSYSYAVREMTTPGLRQIISMTQMTGAILKSKFGERFLLSQGVRALPTETGTGTMEGRTLDMVSGFLFPFALSFLLPTFVSILVQEKEDRHRMMMAMNGLKSGSYYLAHYVEFMTMQLTLSIFFCITCVAISSQFILRTPAGLIVLLLLLWAHLQTCLAFLLGSLFSNTRKATLAVYFFVAVSCIMASAADQIFGDGIPFAWFIHPSFSFFNILATGIRHSSRVNGMYPLHFGDFKPSADGNLFGCLMLLVGESVLFVLLTIYIDAVAPSEYGVQKPWHYPITGFFTRRSHSRDPESKLARGHNTAGPGETDTLEGADADVYSERESVQTRYDPAVTPLIINNLYHCYAGKAEPALKGLSFGVETNTVLGLLGPNGAGKSTMIHLLTGLYRPTSGTASVAGADIRTDMATVHAKIGVCPQHDILWGDLTVADHLLFYSRLRGIPPSLEQQAVTFAIASVSLTKFRDRQVKGLSGGEKRRVSIAIALLGDNSVIFLDEPSTGLDPAVRRIIWDIINRVKVNRTVVLTTHSMEEADILSDRIAIMTAGRLRCIGTSLHLKELYGTGFRLNISSKPGRLDEACQSIEQGLLRGFVGEYRRMDKFTNATTFEFELPQQQGQGNGGLSRIFSGLSQSRMFPAVEDWGVSQTTLEDVFIKIVTEGDSALAMPKIGGQ